MKRVQDNWRPLAENDLVLQAYLLGEVDFESLLLVQRYVHYQISGQRDRAALILCEHPPLITVGRHGSRAHLDYEADAVPWRFWPVRWVQRGGGCWLHLPGQLAVYAIFPVDRLGGVVAAFAERVGQVIAAVLGDFDLRGEVRPGAGGIWVGSRMVAGLGLAIRDWVSCFGACLNIDPDLEFYRRLRSSPHTHEPMTSLARERRGRVRPGMVRERLLEHCQRSFGFARLALFNDHPLLHDGPKRRTPSKVHKA